MSEHIPKTLGEQIADSVAVSAGAYETYLWVVHCLDHPDDFSTAERYSAELTGDLTAPTMNFAMMTTKQAEKFIQDRLVFTFKSALGEIQETWGEKKIPYNYDNAVEKRAVELMQQYLVEIVEPVAIKHIEEEEWWQTDATIRQITNPFRDDDLLEAVWKYADEKIHRQLGSYSLGRLAPGYLTAPPQ